MNDHIKQFRVGVVVLATSIIGAILVTLNGPAFTEWIPGLDKHYQVTIELREAPGIGPDTPIRKNGLLIGRVADIEDLQDHVALKANIDAGRLLYPDYDVRVSTTLLGDATIEFITKPVAPGTPPVQPGYAFVGKVAASPMTSIEKLQDQLQQMIDSLDVAANEVTKLAKNFNEAIGPNPEAGRIPKILDTAEVSMNNLSQAAQTLNNFFGDPELMSTVREARMTMNDVREVAEKVQAPIESIDRNLRNLEGFTEPLGRNGEQVAASLIDALKGLSSIVEELTVLTEALNNREGTIGQLIHNPQIYNNLNLLLCNSNNLVLRINELAKGLRPVVDDARIFMDKIAREPGRVVSGAFSNGPGIK
jgi:phospholipid/cholesterol/gamma-HCH transport system substrate-binding protein